MTNRAIVIVLDGVGAGPASDTAAYGDAGSDTLVNLASAVGGLRVPNLANLGLGRMSAIAGVPADERPNGSWGRLQAVNPGKDSTSGHWELAGIHLDRPFPTYPHGFPTEVIAAFEKAIDRPSIGNVVASGTDIIQRLGDEHVRTGSPIVYTSGDSVFQIAAHEEKVSLEQLYDWCRTARRLLVPPHAVGRVIARPFVGESTSYVRTGNRRDFSIDPTGPTMLDRIKEAGLPVVAIGKIVDLFAGRGQTEQHLTHNNSEGMAAILEALDRVEAGLVMANLVDFDMLWGHRNDPQGFHSGLQAFDAWLPGALSRLRPGDLLMLTADHGNDPTTASTDHSRELVPLIVAGPSVRAGVDLGIRDTFSDLGATVLDHLGLPPPAHGRSFLPDIRPGGAS
ncbi:MAG: phosphopentomutase [Candidatus Eisenbacteria bacterium]|nr:phosphopentomutase [Candidatus Eisenbacteria bacterium]